MTIYQAGPEVLVNTTTADQQYSLSMATLSNGDYVVTWTSGNQDGSVSGIYAQRYSPAGVPLGTETQINTVTANAQHVPSVAALTGGG
jgi:hypothetical protein